MKLLLGLLLLATGLRAELPPAVESLRPQIQAAERRLQDISLELQAAQHAAEPVQVEVAEARGKAASWWGSWMLKRRLGKLKMSLDRVEGARAGQVAARQDLALLLTGADEELSAALEASLGGSTGSPDAAMRAKWKAWWEQKTAWQQRLDALAPIQEGEASAQPQAHEARHIQAEARQAQWDREQGILLTLGHKKALSPDQLKRELRRLQGRFARPQGSKL